MPKKEVINWRVNRSSCRKLVTYISLGMCMFYSRTQGEFKNES